MKFMVMCSLVPFADATPDSRIVEGLAGMGLMSVGASQTEQGLQIGLDRCFVGEFRAPEAPMLESMLRAQVSSLLGGLGSEIGFRLCLVPTRVAAIERKRA